MNLKFKLFHFTKRGWNSPTLMTWGNLLSSSGKLLILTPLILTKYNVDEIALWYLLLTINTLIVVVDFGFYPTFSRIISYVNNGLGSIKDITKSKDKLSQNGKPAWGFMEEVYGTLNSIYGVLSILIIGIVLISTYTSIGNIINRTVNITELWSTYYIFLISVAFVFFAKKFDTVIIGTNHVALINRWNIINNIANSISSILIVFNGLSLEWLAINQLVFSILLLIRNYFLERNICNGKFKNFKLFNFNLDIFKWIWKPTWQSGVLILASTGITQVTGILYSNMSSSAELASYLITLKLVTTVSQFSQAPFYSKLPIFNGLRVQHKLKQLSNQTRKSIFKSLIVYVLGISSLFYLGNYLLNIIGSNAKLESSAFIILMAFVWFFERHHAMHAQIYVTTNKIPFYKTAIISGILNILFIYILMPKIGVWAFPVSLGLSNLAINNWWNVKISLVSINEKFWPYFSKSALIPLCVLILLSIFKLFII